jgi:hypothetical protein
MVIRRIHITLDYAFFAGWLDGFKGAITNGLQMRYFNGFGFLIFRLLPVLFK